MHFSSIISLLISCIALVKAVSYNYLENGYLADLIPISDVEIRTPGLSNTWQVLFECNKTLYRLETKEQWNYSGNNLSTHATKGLSYEMSGQIWHECGSSRLTFLNTNDSHSFQGQFEVNNEVYHIVPQTNSLEIPDHSNHLADDHQYFVWKESDLPLKTSVKQQSMLKLDNHLVKRDTEDQLFWPSTEGLRMSVGNISGCFPKKYFAQIGVAADSNFMSSFNSTKDAYLKIADTVNKASQVWEMAFNISLSLSDIVYPHDDTDYPWNWKCNDTDNSVESLQSRLNALSAWSRTDKPGNSLALWSLFTNCPSESVIGLAWQSTVCTPGAANVIHHSLLDYRVLAHEVGHVFGAVHDCTNHTCGTDIICCPRSAKTCDSKGEYIMNPGSDMQQFVFSECTRGNICGGISRGLINISCLVPNVEKPVVPNLECSDITDPIKYDKCWRDMQCKDYLNSTQAFSCGQFQDCMLTCSDEVTKKCTRSKFPLLDGTSCGFNYKSKGLCVSGSCIRKVLKKSRPIWFWIMMAVIGLAIGGVILAAIILIIVVLYRRFKIRRELHSQPIQIGSPQLIPQFNKQPPKGLRPFLPYRSSITTRKPSIPRQIEKSNPK